MAYTTRVRLKRKLDTCVNQTDFVLRVMKEILDTYPETYPDYREFASVTAELALQLQDLIILGRDKLFRDM